MSVRDKWQQFKATAKGLFRRPAMIGTTPSARPVWHDPAAHARDFAERYAEPMGYLAAQRMMELGIPHSQIGRPDPDHGGVSGQDNRCGFGQF